MIHKDEEKLRCGRMRRGSGTKEDGGGGGVGWGVKGGERVPRAASEALVVCECVRQ